MQSLEEALGDLLLSREKAVGELGCATREVGAMQSGIWAKKQPRRQRMLWAKIGKENGRERSAPAGLCASSGQDKLIVAMNMGKTALFIQITPMQGLQFYMSSPHHTSLFIFLLVHTC